MDFFLIALLVATLFGSCIYDIRSRRIPNWITYSGMAVATAYHSIAAGFLGFTLSLMGLLLGMGIFFIPYLFGILGAGDAKLMGAVGAALGPAGLLTVALLATLMGGVYAIVIFVVNYRYGLSFLARIYTTLTSLIRFRKYVPVGPEPGKGVTIPYAVPIAMGTALHLTSTGLGYQPLSWISG